MLGTGMILGLNWIGEMDGREMEAVLLRLWDEERGRAESEVQAQEERRAGLRVERVRVDCWSRRTLSTYLMQGRPIETDPIRSLRACSKISSLLSSISGILPPFTVVFSGVRSKIPRRTLTFLSDSFDPRGRFEEKEEIC